MTLAWLSLASLVVAILVSCFSRMNVGVLSLAFAWLVGVYVGGMSLNDVLAGFPVQLFLTLAGVTLLFSQAQLNGTLDKVAHAAARLCGGNVGLIPVMFFVLAAVIASLGPGNIATAAMLAPMAMPMAVRAGVPVFLMAIMVGNGAQAAALSPFAPTGIIVNGVMARIGFGGHEWRWYWTNLVAHAIVAFGGYLLLGGWRLFSRRFEGLSEGDVAGSRLDRANWITILAVLGVVTAVLFGNANIGMAAFVAAVVLAAAKVADHEQAIKRMPWQVITMVSGVTILIAMLEKTGGLDLFTGLLAGIATPATLTGVMAFVTATISVYSSTSGVVLPAFLPTIPGLIMRMGGGDPLALAASMNIAGHLVDMSPLSTTGAVTIAGVPDGQDIKPLYNKLLAWGLSMTVVGAIGCWIFFR
jgi:di/tricarboxylate transporter